jgi:hypothetical protein
MSDDEEGSVFTVFYSWQKNTPSSINRNFIEKALKKAIKEAGKDYKVQRGYSQQGTRD